MCKTVRWSLIAAILVGTFVGADARAFTLHVQDQDGGPVSGFRWLVEEDTTYPVLPGVPSSESLAVNIHRSHAPVLATGHSETASAAVDLPAEARYMVSVLPDSGTHQMSGANVAEGQAAVTVVVNAGPIPTAQISVYAFEDSRPINGAPDVPAEQPLEGFSVMLADAAGQVMMDAFGNMIGTTYLQDKGGAFVLDGEGSPIVDTPGTGIVRTDANGEALIKYLAPNKYGVQVAPPPGDTSWVQVSTLEGTPTVDAWVQPAEPPYFAEWGFFDWHVFIGFLHPMTLPPSAEPTGTITGQVLYVHQMHPPLAPGLEPGVPVPTAWVGLNDLNAADQQIHAQPCDSEGNFTIENVPPGTYQLVMWDLDLDAIIDFRTIIVPPEGGLIDLGPVPVYAWFGFLEGNVFYDDDLDGYPDPTEGGVPQQAVNLRFIDGSIYQSTTTDPSGDYEFGEVFPFFFWLVAEVDFARYQATGLTVVVDDGGPLAPGAPNNPQPQPENGDLPWRTEQGVALTEAMLLYAGQTNEAYWGKVAYEEGQNGGISGIMYYATTRAEDDPRYAAAEPWEPGIPRAQVNLYADYDDDRVIDDLDEDGGPTLADVDNHPLGWADGDPRGDEDVDRDADGLFDPGDALNITWTDSWDDAMPDAVGDPQYVHGDLIVSGAETLRTWNQLRPGVFDGGYAFSSYVPGGMTTGAPEVEGLPPGYYIVEGVTPPGYQTVKEEDKNVDFGDQYIPFESLTMAVQAFPPVPSPPPVLVGDPHLVPAELTLFPGIEAPYAGEWRPLGDRKQVLLADGENAAVDFFVFTEVPRAGRIWGVVLNDVLLEFDPNSPNKGTNLGASWMPVAIRDWRGHELARVYTDEWGKYNALVPSTFTVNLPSPTGVSPNMLTASINDPGPIPDPLHPGQYITDPWYNPGYGQIRTTWDFLPGKTTRLDTPVLPIAAFTANPTPLDCNFPDGTPIIYSVSGPAGGPAVPAKGGQITILSVGSQTVPNPDYDPTDPSSTPTITRDYGFGSSPGTVTLDGVSLQNVTWAVDGMSISATVPNKSDTGQLMVTRGDNLRSTVMGVTLHVGATQVTHVAPGQSIQAAVDNAQNFSLILVAPGVYKENVIMWKPVKLQGWGAYSTMIQAGPMTPEEQAAWDAKLQSLIDGGKVVLIEGERPDFYLERGAGVTVVRKGIEGRKADPSRIDGFTITGAIKGGGVFVNAAADRLQISNNKIVSNQGSFGGGVRIGTPSLVNADSTGYLSSGNALIAVHHNHITQNGGIDGGGGIALFNGSDEYAVTDNVICGNFSLLYGGGIAHFGLSPDGLIRDNVILSNQAFDEGGGIMVAGELVPAGAPPGTLTPGSGPVSIVSNLIQGNLSGDDGGGIRALMVNGQDVQDDPDNPDNWYAIEILNNMIVNNVSADAGGGISLDDAARVWIVNNTVAHNDSTATGVDAFGGPVTEGNPPGQWAPPEAGEPGLIGGLITSVPQVAGIAARAHSTGLQAAFAPGYQQQFANPALHDNIIWQNRSFYWDAEYTDFGGLRPDVGMGEPPVFWDLAVYGTLTPELLDPMYSVLTHLEVALPGGGTAEYDATNTDLDPLFVDPYFNVFQATSKGAAFGNLVTVTFLPTGLRGDYHILPGSSAIDLGGGLYLPMFAELGHDWDGDPRPAGPAPDAGADEAQ